MRANLAAGFLYIGTIFLSFGIVLSVIGLMGARHGVHHARGVVLAVVLVAGGAILLGASSLVRRSLGAPTSNN